MTHDHITDPALHLFRGVCICPCVNCTRSGLGTVLCVCPECDSRACGCRTLTRVAAS